MSESTKKTDTEETTDAIETKDAAEAAATTETADTTEAVIEPTEAKAEPAVWVIKLMTKTHLFLNWLTFGKMFNSFKGDDVCFVTMIGAKSGKRITIPLMYVPHKDGVLLVASKRGSPRNPVWYHNLVKYPVIKVRHRGTLMNLQARLADADEKEQLWPICDASYGDYAEYRKLTDRDIPIFVCAPA